MAIFEILNKIFPVEYGSILDETLIFSAPPTFEQIRDKVPVCYIDSHGVHFSNSGHGYLGLPQVNENLDQLYHIEILFGDFERYLKRSSLLRTLAQKSA